MMRACLEDLAGEDPGFAEECRIHAGEREEGQLGLVVTVQSRQQRILCEYHYIDHVVERYVLERHVDEAGAYLQLWSEVNGWRYRAEPGTVPFGLLQLLRQLEELPDAEPFLALLGDARLCQLATALPFDALVALTRFTRHDYPAVYLLVAAGFAGGLPSGSRTITRQSLARCLGVASLSNGQMAALRKLSLDHGLQAGWLAACQLIGREWPFLCRAVGHVSWLDPRAVQFLVAVKQHGEDLLQCRWIDHELAMRWPSAANGYVHGCLLIGAGCHQIQFLVIWAALKVHGIAPQSCRDDRELVQRFVRCMGDKVFAPGFTRRKQARLVKKVQKAIDPAWQLQAGSIFDMLLDDMRHNDDAASCSVADCSPLATLDAEPGYGFTPLATAGDLRAMAKLLHNCAASRVWQGVIGESSFWRYDNAATGEVALLQLYSEAFPGENCVIEFNGMHNAGVSEQAREDLRRWLAASRGKLVSTDPVGKLQ